MTIRWQILGAQTALVDGDRDGTVDTGIDLNLRPRAVLLRLLVEPNVGVPWEKVAAFLWADEPPKTQRNSVARFIADLRQALGPHGDRIVTEGGGYRVVVRDGELDREVARTALSEAKALCQGDVEQAHAMAETAMQLAGTAPNPWLLDLPEADPVLRANEELRLEAIDVLAELKMQTGRHREIVPLAEAGVAAHPYAESLWAHLIAALQASGRTAEALRTCQRLRNELAEIGLEPGDVVRRLESRILSGGSAGLALSPDSVAGAPTGRDAEMLELETVSAACRLVTVTGLAGSGKSALAQAIGDAERLFDVTVHHVDLRSLRDARRVVPAVAAAVGVPASEAVATPEALARHLAPISCLVILDNCEHLRPECAALAEAVLAGALGVRMLTTSREALRVADEHVYRLGTLATRLSPDVAVASPAASVFIELAGSQVAPDQLDDVEAICELVNGQPSAIELAAGLLTTSSLSNIRIQLGRIAPASPTEASTAVLDLAWDALGLAEQTVLARMSVFADSCTLAAAEHVCGEQGSIAASLDQLVAHGMVRVTQTGRFALAAPVREFAAARLSDRRETSVVIGRLAAWLSSITKRWSQAELGAFAEPSRLLLPEQANLNVALSHLRDEGRHEELAWFALRCCGLWINHGMCSEINAWFLPIVDDTTVSNAARSAAATCLLEAAMTTGEYEHITPWGQMAIDLAEGRPHDWIPMLTGFLSLWAILVPMPMSTADLLDVAEATSELSESRHVNRASTLMRRAHAAHHARRYDEAVDSFRAALELVDEEGRLLLALEMGETISLYLAGRREEALASVRSWRSRVETDEWHYQVDIVGSIIVGGCGDPEMATANLAAALRRHQPIAVWARADEFQTAFGLLAAYRGEPKLSEELLATPLSGSPFLSSIVVEHMVAERGLDTRGFRELATEMRNRTLPEIARRDSVTSQRELVSWWSSGAMQPSSAT